MSRRVTAIVWITFWTVAYFVLLSIFSSSGEWQRIDYIYTVIFMTTLMAAVVVNEYFRRRYFASGRYLAWLAIAVADGVAFAAVNDFLFDKVIDYILPGYYFIAYYSHFDLLKFFGAFLGLSTLIGLSMESFQLQKEKSTAEFKALANQVNPHFLFNGLTVLYTLSFNNNNETSSAIIKLSDILRYVIYKSPDNRVSLASEASILRDYIDLQRYRVHPDTKIEYVENLHDDVTIAPMLFLPLLENAFKHGEAVITMELRCEKNVVNFNITNKRTNVRSAPGIGLSNLKERLKLLYPGRHSFRIVETENKFSVNMRISL
ncbi:MAG: histidine kinase [Bacteroidota bacterium]